MGQLVSLATLEGLRLRLGDADEDDPFGPVKASAIFSHDVVLALARHKVHDRNSALLSKGLDLGREIVGNPAQQDGQRNFVPSMHQQKVDQLRRHLQRQNLEVEIDTIQTLERHMIAQQVVNVRHRPASSG